ncbi:MAG: enoyl-CoA hydratase/isomerase family protein [Dehalococcoidia bacterium]|nr:enoyl-CoA hydratase/isomerase family protein [Dehalococcoidia bacterium]
MTYETLIFEQSDGVAVVTLNRPDRLNALSPGLIHELALATEELKKNDEIKVAVITGARRPDGRPCFSAGVDLKEAAKLSSEEGQAIRREAMAFLDDLESLPKPTIGAIDGVCTAGGLELALVLDIRIASTTAAISDMHVKNLGGMGGFGLPARLPRLIGSSRAKEMAFTGDVLNGEEAWRIGLVNRVCAPEQLMEESLKLARQIAGMRPLALEANKACFDMGLNMDLHEALRYAEVWHRRLGAVADRASAFLEKK